MVYRELFGTESISRLGFGCMRLPVNEKNGAVRVYDEKAIPLIRSAYEKGINYFDTAWTYCGGDSERAMGAALKPFRNKVKISTKLPMWEVKTADDFWLFLKQSLSRLDTDYIDYYHFHSVNQAFWNTIQRLDFIGLAQKAQKMGCIKHISFSFHDQPALLKEITDSGVFDSVLCQNNILFTLNEDAIRYAKQKGLGVFIMGPLCGGTLASAGNSFGEIFNTTASPVEIGLKFVWGNPNVDCLLSGMQTEEELCENARYSQQFNAIAMEEWNELKQCAEGTKRLLEIYCTDCQYCFVCPHNIRPSHIFKMYSNLTTWKLEESAKKAYDILCRDEWWYGAHPDLCTNCGRCVKKCPQGLLIPHLLKKSIAKLKTL